MIGKGAAPCFCIFSDPESDDDGLNQCGGSRDGKKCSDLDAF